MKHFKKLIAVILTVVLVSSLALPTVAFAAADDEHQSPDDFYEEVVDPDTGDINWTEVPVWLFNFTFLVEIFETIGETFRTLLDQILGFFANFIPDPDDFLPEIPECPEEVPSEVVAA